MSDDRKLELAGDPMIVAVDVFDGDRIPDLVPEDWRPRLGDWIAGAVGLPGFPIGGAR